MMIQAQGPEQCSSSYPFPELISSGRLEVHVLLNPTLDKFGEAQKLLEPNLLYPQMFSSLIGPSLPTIVYLEIPSGGKTAHALHSKGVPYVIYWKNAFSTYSATHFRQALLSVVQSSCSHIWDAFQLAKASFQLYCVRNNYVLPADGPKVNGKLGPRLLGDAPKINIAPPEKVMGEGEEEENSSDGLPAIQIYSDDVDMSFLVCGVPCTLDACLLSSLEDGLNALLNIEIRGSKLQNRVSAAPPPLQAGALSRGVVTMRCDITTSSSAHISLLVSGSAQTCFDDQLLECHIKNELIEKSHLVHALSILEVWMKLPSWAAQVLKNLAREVSYRSLVALGIASVQGIPVASFEKEDAERLLFFCNGQDSGFHIPADLLSRMPTWSSSFTRKRSAPNPETKPIITNNTTSKKRLRFGKDYQALKREGSWLLAD
uniref:Uncharacterized protein n=1 Tax=Ananas comosus var. bracteatus TaxID=296719 RepID=A0A6V7Q5B2_ANACO|nr:unnamed protein product [Ananas comosus var. bracteatus]